MIKSLEDCRNKKFLELLSWWEKACPSKGLPLRSAFDPLDHPKLWPQMFICDVRYYDNNKLKFIYRYVGGEIERAFNVACTGRSIDDPLIEDNKNLSNEQFEECIKDRKPVYCRHNFTNRNMRELEFERIIAPMSRHGDEADSVIGVYEFSKAWNHKQKRLY